MNLETVISIFGQIATLVTVILVYLTLNEMKNQRKVSQKPDLILPNTSVYGYVFDDYVATHDTLIPVPRHWSRKKFETVNSILELLPPITLYNVGVGVAKNVKLNWTIDYALTLEQIKDYCYRNSIPIFIELKEKEIIVVEQYNATEKRIYSTSSLQEKHKYLMPVTISSNDGLNVSLPGIYTELVSLIVYLTSHHQIQDINSIESLEIKFPLARLEIVYEDVESYRYSKKIEVLFSLLGYYSRYVGSDAVGKEMFQGILDFSEL